MAKNTDFTRRKIMTVSGISGLAACIGGLAVGMGLVAPKGALARAKKVRKYPKLEHAINALTEAKADIEENIDRSRTPELRRLREKAITAIEVAIVDLKMIMQSE